VPRAATLWRLIGGAAATLKWPESRARCCWPCHQGADGVVAAQVFAHGAGTGPGEVERAAVGGSRVGFEPLKDELDLPALRVGRGHSGGRHRRCGR